MSTQFQNRFQIIASRRYIENAIQKFQDILSEIMLFLRDRYTGEIIPTPICEIQYVQYLSDSTNLMNNCFRIFVQDFVVMN